MTAVAAIAASVVVDHTLPA